MAPKVSSDQMHSPPTARKRNPKGFWSSSMYFGMLKGAQRAKGGETELCTGCRPKQGTRMRTCGAKSMLTRKFGGKLWLLQCHSSQRHAANKHHAQVYTRPILQISSVTLSLERPTRATWAPQKLNAAHTRVRCQQTVKFNQYVELKRCSVACLVVRTGQLARWPVSWSGQVPAAC